jgi:SSS family solute:Na+ symporter
VNAILIHQGISDAATEAKAAADETNLRQFLAHLCADFAKPETPVVLARENASPRMKPELMEQVCAPIVRVAESTPRIAWINVDDLERVKGHHFTAAAQMEIGKRYATALLGLRAKSPRPASSPREHARQEEKSILFRRPVHSLLPAAWYHQHRFVNIAELLSAWDFAVIAAYALVLIGIGLWVGRKLKGAEDQFLGGRSVRWYNIAASIFGTNVGPAFLIASATAAYSMGMVTASFEWLAWICLFLLSVVFLPHYLNLRVTTMPEFVKRRYGMASYNFLSYYALFTTLVLWVAGALYPGAVLLSQMLAWPLWGSAVALMALCLVITVSGGLLAIAITNTYQTILIIGGALALTLIGLHHVGGIGQLIEKTPPHYWTLFRPLSDKDYPWLTLILGYPVIGLWFWCTDQTIVQCVLAARGFRQGMAGCLAAGFLKIIPPFIFMLPGILCFLLHPNLKSADEAFLTMVTNYLPVGMKGLICVVLIAALVSTVDAGINSFSTILTLDIWVRQFRPQASKEEIRTLGRVTTGLVAVLGVLCAISMGGVGKNIFDLFQSIIAYFAPPMAAVFLIGVLWKRATGKAAFATLVGGTIVCLSIGALDFYHRKLLAELFGLLGLNGVPHFLYLSFALFVLCVLNMIVLSLATQKSSEEEALPSLGEVYVKLGEKTRGLMIGWGVLAVVMVALYLGFEALSRR